MAAERLHPAAPRWSARLGGVRVRPLHVLVTLQLTVIVVAGVLTATRLPLFSPIDETAHFDYVRVLAEDHRLPVLGEDKMGWASRALDLGLDPDATPTPYVDPATGLSAESYQAFEPPLYYLLVTPAFFVIDDWSQRAKLVRLLGLGFLLATVGVLYRFAARVLPEARLLAFSVALTVLMWPGVIVRSVTVSNAVLELLLACACLYTLWCADEDNDERLLLLAAALLGLGLLTKLTLVALAPLLVVVAVRHARRGGQRRDWVIAAASMALPLVLLAPWVIFNLHHYDALTAGALAKEMQEATVNPDGVTWTVGRFIDMVPRLFQGVLPQEWAFAEVQKPLIGLSLDYVKAALFGLAALLLVVGPGAWRSRHAMLLAAPFLLGIAMVGWVTLVEQWPIASSRRLYAELPALALFAAVAWWQLFSSRRVAPVLAVATSLVLALAWIDLASDNLL